MAITRRGFLGRVAATAASGIAAGLSPMPSAKAAGSFNFDACGNTEIAQLVRFHEYGPIRYAQFHDRAISERLAPIVPELRRDTTLAFGPAASRIYNKALAYQAMLGSEIGLCDAILQHDGGAGRVPRQMVLTLRFDSGSAAVFSASPGTIFPQTDMVRYAAGSLALLGDGRFRFTDNQGDVKNFVAGPRLQSTPTSCTPQQARLLHDAFVRAFA